jgi:hypothetical protein
MRSNGMAMRTASSMGFLCVAYEHAVHEEVLVT